MSTALPLEQTTEPRPKPWLLHVLDVNAMNFCEYASCPVTRWPERLPRAETGGDDSGLLIAVPNTLASEAVRDAYPTPLSMFPFGDS